MADHYLSEQHQNTILRFLTSGQFADMDQTALSVSKIQGNMDITLINDNVNTRMQSLELMYNAARCLRNDFTDLQKKMSDIQQEIKSLERSFQERTVFFDEQKYNQDILQQNIEELRQKLEDKQYIPYDGSYTWEIKDVQKRLCKKILNPSLTEDHQVTKLSKRICRSFGGFVESFSYC